VVNYDLYFTLISLAVIKNIILVNFQRMIMPNNNKLKRKIFFGNKPLSMFLLFTFIILLVTGCDKNPRLIPAPLGNKAALEKLSKTYRQQSDILTSTPTSLTPQGRKKFLVQVFKAAGYDYSKSLVMLGDTPKANITQYHRDLKQLLYLPHYDRRLTDLSTIYSKEEIAAISNIDATFK
jgi:hypothetical protein